jgi:thiamine-monophosphate kinase
MTRFPVLGPGREFDLIRDVAQTVHDHAELVVGPGDDCAVLNGGWVITCDASVENVHFRREWLNAEEIGYRATAVALSDVAAVAATPVAILSSLVSPTRDYGHFVHDIMAGVMRAAAAAGAILAGGDTTHTDGPLVIDVTAMGMASAPILRSGARLGDEVWVTGHLGAAASAVYAWLRGKQPDPAARTAFANPQPRVHEALWLGDRADIHSLIDISDGLAADLQHIAAASSVAITVHADLLPVPSDLADLKLALSGGDDYELCFTAAPGEIEPISNEFIDQFGIALSRIGEVQTGSGVRILDSHGQPIVLERAGYDHFGDTT